MVRVKGGPRARKRHAKIIGATKGYRGTRKKLYKRAHEAYLRAGQHAYAGRRLRKRDMRRLWIQRINAALTEYNISYSKFIKLLKKAKIELDRKILAQLAIEEPEVFKGVVNKISKNLASGKNLVPRDARNKVSSVDKSSKDSNAKGSKT